MDVLGITHVLFAVAALLCGAVVIALPKGTKRHKAVGWTYAVSMMGLNGTALFIFELFGGFGAFHWAALGSLLTVVVGIVPAVRRRPPRRWVELHAQLMSWSYVGLLAAAAAEILTRMPGQNFWWAVLAASVTVFFTGALVIRRFSPLSRLLAQPKN